MAERNSPGNSRTTTRRLRDYEARRRELTDAFRLPDDLRVWVLCRYDTDDNTPDTLSVGGEAGITRTTMDFPMPAELQRLLRKFLADHREEMERQLKMDMASNLLATMSGAPTAEDDE